MTISENFIITAIHAKFVSKVLINNEIWQSFKLLQTDFIQA